ncbi:twin-arginine translocase TatA/TatE family subunit [Gulosibacter chungangensis]|uniref:Sec-independent protein translocase protein TatA n=1 Tax=Gulosibacter chungangensis TaxID=979746 RepID=A0A7J5BAQ9_9MICO|nr:twin-arginine translocase TatA/TatE family subunit [Gulosibacter chungangensis]KAB1643151.1 twin-arginine translocase TatA/TatE family subunit [Gulosibacter chungangensis]
MFQNLTGWHLLIILAIVMLLFGAGKLPDLARSVGQSMRIFRNEMSADAGARDASQPVTVAEEALEMNAPSDVTGTTASAT